MEWNVTYVAWAGLLGFVSSVSLPVGALVGISFKFRPLIISIMGAFGAGALVAALSLELVAPVVFEAGQHSTSYHLKLNLISLIFGAIVGGISYYVLDQIANKRGGYLRKTGNQLAFYLDSKRNRRKVLVRELGKFPLMRVLTLEQVRYLLPRISQVSFSDGEVISKKGREFDGLYLIRKGEVQLSRLGENYGKYGPGTELGVLINQEGYLHKAPLDAHALGHVTALRIKKIHIDKLRGESVLFDNAYNTEVNQRVSEYEKMVDEQTAKSQQWKRSVLDAVVAGEEIPSSQVLNRVHEEEKGSSLAIWLGTLLDGIPESFVIGTGIATTISKINSTSQEPTIFTIINFTLIMGLFIANFPEALSSAANMKSNGKNNGQIMALWTSLTIICALGSALGYIMAYQVDPIVLNFAEGLAAGAMLTMIAAAMIPEAVHIGNPNAVGLSTLCGFLTAVSFKLIQ